MELRLAILHPHPDEALAMAVNQAFGEKKEKKKHHVLGNLLLLFKCEMIGRAHFSTTKKKIVGKKKVMRNYHVGFHEMP